MSKEKDSLKNDGKKKLSIKEIGLPKIALLLVLGVCLILLSVPELFQSNKKKKPSVTSRITQAVQETDSNGSDCVAKMENKLELILSKVSDIGKVKVMITLKSSKEQIVLKDTPYTKESLIEDDGEGGKRENQNFTKDEETILVTDDEGQSVPYILQEIEPVVEGILVIAEGGDNAKVIADIVETAGVLYGVPAHKVKVLKMK